MKKCYILAVAALLFAFNVRVQGQNNDLQFQHADGTVVENGAVVNCVNVTEDDFLGDYIPSGLYLKNTSDRSIPTAVKGNIKSIPAGAIQFCMLKSCNSYGKTGTVTKTGVMTAGTADDLMLEWMGASIGTDGNFVYDGLPGQTATITLQVEVRNASNKASDKGVGSRVVAYGPAITVNFTWPSPTGITNVRDIRPDVVARYNVRGERITTPEKGINILRMSNGMTIKQIIK